MRFSASIALAGLLVSAISVQSSHAADLLGKLRTTISPVSHEDNSLSWYLRGDITHSRFREPQSEYTVVAVAPNIGPINFRDGLIRKTWGAGIGAGVRWRFARFDLTFEKRRQTRHLAYAPPFNDWNHPGPFPVPARRDYFDFNSHTIMANAYADLGTWHGVTPYVGAGIGATHFSTTGMYVSQPLPLTAALGGITLRDVIGNRKTWSLSWALMAGVAVNVTKNLKVDIGYRFANLGKMKFNHVDATTGAVLVNLKTEKIQSHDIRVGLRYEFGMPKNKSRHNTFAATPASAYGRGL